MDNIWDIEDIQLWLKNGFITPSRKSENLYKNTFSDRVADSQQNYL